MKRTFKLDLNGRKLVVEVGEMAKQAAGAALVRYENTAVLSVCAISKQPTPMSYFPLMVIYQEKMYAAGKIPGGFLKREGRPSDNETLTARLIDRPLRPLFPKGFMYDLQVINTAMSVDTDYTPEMTAMIGSSLALGISDIPFLGPIAGVNVGYIEGQYVLNPTQEQLEVTQLELSIAGTKDAVNMVESSGREVPEDIMLGAIQFGHEWIKVICEFQEEIIAEVGLPKGEYELKEIPESLTEEVTAKVKDELVEAVRIEEKLARGEAISAIKDRIKAEYEEANMHLDRFERGAILSDVNDICTGIVKKEMRRLVTIDKIRPDGRKIDEIRPLDSQIDLFELTHGSAMFTRGQTQALAFTTLGSMSEYKIIDGMEDEIEKKTFMLHYNFPQYSVGETGRYGPPKRREIGHGMLGERALRMVMPDEEDFPYTVRIVSEILESNGSSSQATICAGSMSLMAAGVPIKAQVAGIAMGLIKDGDNYTILTDIQGMEDHYGDMDFKVAGTEAGITALQMDIKVDGLSEEILTEALMQAKKARLEILANMNECISEPRPEVSKYAPKVRMLTIDVDKIRDVIGPGGKQITAIIEASNDVKIDIEQDGRVYIMHSDNASIDKAIAMIEDIVREAKPGEVYSGKVTRVEKFGCFVELWPGTEGLCHISKLAHERTNKVEDICNVGDMISVKVIGIDDRGRIDLSRKATLPKPKHLPEDKKHDSKPRKRFDNKDKKSDKK